jgi:hypothetical protein
MLLSTAENDSEAAGLAGGGDDGAQRQPERAGTGAAPRRAFNLLSPLGRRGGNSGADGVPPRPNGSAAESAERPARATRSSPLSRLLPRRSGRGRGGAGGDSGASGDEEAPRALGRATHPGDGHTPRYALPLFKRASAGSSAGGAAGAAAGGDGSGSFRTVGKPSLKGHAAKSERDIRDASVEEGLGGQISHAAAKMVRPRPLPPPREWSPPRSGRRLSRPAHGAAGAPHPTPTRGVARATAAAALGPQAGLGSEWHGPPVHAPPHPTPPHPTPPPVYQHEPGADRGRGHLGQAPHRRPAPAVQGLQARAGGSGGGAEGCRAGRGQVQSIARREAAAGAR